MCKFFSFISDGKGNVKYFNLEQRKELTTSNPEGYVSDSHSSIASFFGNKPNSDDECNKYEYSNGEFIIDQINMKNDSRKAKKWINEFSKSQEFYEMCKIAVAQDGDALLHVPNELKTIEMCKIAVAQYGYALLHVPSELKTIEMCKIAVAQDGDALRHVPNELKTIEMCKIAVAQYGYALRHVPNELKTIEMCKIAVAQYGYALRHVPSELKTIEMCKIAVAQDGDALLHVPNELKNDFM